MAKFYYFFFLCLVGALFSYSASYITSSAELGGGFARHVYDSQWSVAGGGASHYALSGQEVGVGIRLNAIKPLTPAWSMGGSAAIRYYFGRINSRHSSVPAHTFFYEANQDFRYELSALVSHQLNSTTSFYLKGGALIGRYHVKASDYTFQSNKMKNTWGFTVGAGVEVPITSDVTLGALIEYDRYQTLKNPLTNINGTVGRYTMTPSMVNVMLTFSCKLNYLIQTLRELN